MLLPLTTTGSEKTSSPISTISFIFVVALSLSAFSLREIPLTSDDNAYLDYFYLFSTSFSEVRYYLSSGFGTDLFSFIEGEPLFAIYSAASSILFDPDISIRVLIILSIVPHLFVSTRLRHQNSWVYITGYLLFVELAPHLSWVQLRQGLAVALLALVFEIKSKKWQIVGIAMLGLIHSSLLILLPLFLLGFARQTNIAYVIIAAVSIAILLQPDFANSLSFLMGRRESVYFAVDATYSYRYVLFCTILSIYVTVFFRNPDNKQEFITYHAMIVIILPLFFLPTVGAFAERLFFVTRWYELWIITRVYNKNNWPIMGYLAFNLVYTMYYTSVNSQFTGDAISYYLDWITR